MSTSEVKSQKSKVKSQKSKVKSQKSKVKSQNCIEVKSLLNRTYTPSAIFSRGEWHWLTPSSANAPYR
ncbi:MAG: hypothetical protein SWX82_03970 [Cyanobacteriota bacterium]|nr:hypothetical protein [Cyanobacteriota bacterium]